MKPNTLISTILVMMLGLSGPSQQAQAQQPASASDKTDSSADAVSRVNSSPTIARLWRGRRPGFSLMPSSSYPGVTAASSNSAVHGSGTVGKISMWVDIRPNGDSTLGDSIITQLNGNIGVGLATPASKLSVQGMIETTLGGYKFPDGTVQTTAAVSGLQSVIHDSTLAGAGTDGSPLGVAVPLSLTGSVPNPILSITNMGNGLGMFVSSNFGVGADVRGGTGSGDGLPGVFALGGHGFNGDGGSGVQAAGGFSSSLSRGGIGVKAFGGVSNGDGGNGVETKGGDGNGSGGGGNGIVATGGNPSGDGVVATGGNRVGDISAGRGVVATGGNDSRNDGFGGVGVFAIGGDGPNGAGGTGLFAIGGNGSPSSPTSLAAVFHGGVHVDGDLDVLGPLDGGNLSVTGDLNVGGTKNFKIDHPLDPENKYLLHAAIESSEVLNVYSGNIVTDGKGHAIVTLPEWFEALNRDPRYQLTVIGTFAQAIVATKIKQNRFTIRTSAPNVEVSWQVTGVRSDALMRKQPFKAEEDKPERERGTYLTPELFGKPQERGVEWARNPELMQTLKQQLTKTAQVARRQRK